MKLSVTSVLSALLLATLADASLVPAHPKAALGRRHGQWDGSDVLNQVSDGIDSILGAVTPGSSGTSHRHGGNHGHAAGSRNALQSSSGSAASSSSGAAGTSTNSASNDDDDDDSDAPQGRQRSSFRGMPKFGLAWPNGGSFNISNFINDNVGWYYSWDATPGWKNAPTNITFCPMLWGEKNVDSFQRHVNQNLDGKYNQGRCVLGMNEPNQRGQSDMSPQTACMLMAQYVVPLKMSGFHIVSPATTSAPSGTDWMDEFRTTCPGVWSAIDSVAVHFYDVSTKKFKKYVSDWYQRYNKPIWVTEYACQNFNGGSQCSQQKTINFQMEMARWFEEQDFVQAYAPFGVMRDMQGVSAYNQLASHDQPNILYNALTS